MANDTTLTVVGNLVADPELRFTNSGVAVANFTVASTPRFFSKQDNEWKDGDALFLRVNVWRDYAEHVAETLTRGMRVVVMGKLRQRNWEDKDNNKRTSYELEAEEVAPSLRYATASVKKLDRNGGNGSTRPDEWHTMGGAGDDQAPPF